MKKFIIDHIDPFGQGVYKIDDKIFFIPKTLPDEKGTFNIIKKKKGVHFCELINVEQRSPKRIDACCPHFSHCNGCHFLHTAYEDELTFKMQSFMRQLRPISEDTNLEIKCIASTNRLHYRNRIQLHYNIKKDKIGFKSLFGKSIINVPHCKIFRPELQTSFDDILQNWKSEIKKSKHPNSGHIELYLHDDKVKITWNAPYASEGFTQVNQDTNEKIIQEISSYYQNKSHHIIDLFGGKGNLVRDFKEKCTLSVDQYPDKIRNEKFFHLDLYDENALNEFSNATNFCCDTLIVDPPRSGFNDLEVWAKHYRPKHLVYVSCHSATMVRDISPLIGEYKINQTFMIDLFPGTYHYEAMLFLEKA